MIGPLRRLGEAATLRQHSPQMTQRRCSVQAVYLACFKVDEENISEIVKALVVHYTG